MFPRLPDHEDVPLPPYLKGAVRAFWQRVVPDLVPYGAVTATDAPKLALMCGWWVRYWKCVRAQDRLRLGNKRLHRVNTMAATAWQHFDVLAERFGMTRVQRDALRWPEGQGRKAMRF
jgi:phage terminase small subunit